MDPLFGVRNIDAILLIEAVVLGPCHALALGKDRPIFLDVVILCKFRLELTNCPFCFRKRTPKHAL